MQAEAVGHAVNEDVDPHMGVAHIGIAETQDRDGAMQVPFEVGDTKEPVLKNRRPITSYMITAVSISSMKPASRANRWQGRATM
jgi:hypothetical protein